MKRSRKRVGVSDVPAITPALAPGDVWAIDFHFHSASAGKPLMILSIVDERTRQALGGQVEYLITAGGLIDQLDVLTIKHGSPKALREWASELNLVFIPPGQHSRNGFIQSFKGRLRDECLSVKQF